MVALKIAATTNLASCDGINSIQVIEPRHTMAAGPVSLSGQSAVARTLRVLVVDDDHDTADMLDMLIRHWGHQSLRVYDACTAIRTALEVRPDVVLLDVEMPTLGGCELATQLRKHFSRDECLIIAITGRADDERRLACNVAGIDLVLLKPVDPIIVETLLTLEGTRVNETATSGDAFITAIHKI